MKAKMLLRMTILLLGVLFMSSCIEQSFITENEQQTEDNEI